MFKFIRKLHRSIRVSAQLEKAWSFTAKGNIDEAELLFLKINEEFKELSAEHQIMEAYIKFKAGKYIEAVELFDLAWIKIETDNELSKNEKLYFKGYTLGPAKISLAFVKKDNLNAGYKNIKPFDISDINLCQISSKWKVHFPVRDHPDWNKQ